MPIQSHDPRDHMDPDESYCDPIGMPMPPGHHAKLGRLLLLCAEAESSAHIVARRLTLSEEPIARILIGQPRFDDLLNLVAKLAKARGLSGAKIVRINLIRTHLKYVYSVRNIVAHQSPAWRAQWVRYDRYQTVRDLTDREGLIYVASLDELDNLANFTQFLVYALATVDLDDSFEAQSEHHYQAAVGLLANLPLPAKP